MAADPFSGNVGLEDFIKVFQAHGIEVTRVRNQDGREYIKFKKGDRIEVFDPDPVIYKGKAHRTARSYGVPIPDLYTPDKFTSKP